MLGKKHLPGVNRSCESDILLYLSACVFSFALMPFICIQSGHKRGDVKLTVLSDLLVGTHRVLKTLRMYVVVSNHVFPLQANLVYSKNVDTKLFGGNYDRNKKRLTAVRENEDHIFSQRASRIYDA